jgi:hypothetical protein
VVAVSFQPKVNVEQLRVLKILIGLDTWSLALG